MLQSRSEFMQVFDGVYAQMVSLITLLHCRLFVVSFPKTHTQRLTL